MRTLRFPIADTCGSWRMLLLFFLIFMSNGLFGQDSLPRTESWTDRMFGTQLEVGYVNENSDLLGGGILFKTAIEYRVRKVRHLFIRADYDDYDVTYDLADLPGLAREIRGGASFTDLLIGAGYRGGDQWLRWTVLLQGGGKLYAMPQVAEENGQLAISLEGRSIFATRGSLGLELYLDEAFAFAIDVFHNRVLGRRDFWTNQQGAWGISIGLIGAAF